MSERIVNDPSQHGWVEENGKWVWDGSGGSIQDGDTEGQITTWSGTEWTPEGGVVVDASGNVGIGVDSPLTDLDVRNNINMGDGTSVTQLSMARNNANYIAASDANGFLVFRTGGTTERMRIDSNGNVGIGVDTVSYNNKLVVDQGGDYAGSHETAAILVRSSTSSNSENTHHGAISFSKGTGQASISAVQTGNSVNNLGLSFWTHPSSTGTDPAIEAMRIDASGSVVTGSDPGYVNNPNGTTLRPDGTVYTNNVQLADNSGSVGGTAPCLYSPAQSTFAISTARAERMRIDANGSVDMQNALTVADRIYLRRLGGNAAIPVINHYNRTGKPLSDTTNKGNDLAIGTTSGGASLFLCTDDAERVEIDSNGRVDITGSLYVNGSEVGSGGAYVPLTGNSTVNGTITATDFIATSDERLKEDISPLPVGLIDDIKPVQWNWKDGSGKSAGVIAQQLQAIGLDDFVNEDADGNLGVNYNALVGVLLAEVISLKAEVEALK